VRPAGASSEPRDFTLGRAVDASSSDALFSIVLSDAGAAFFTGSGRLPFAAELSVAEAAFPRRAGIAAA
jgi:hypothetical protein